MANTNTNIFDLKILDKYKYEYFLLEILNGYKYKYILSLTVLEKSQYNYVHDSHQYIYTHRLLLTAGSS